MACVNYNHPRKTFVDLSGQRFGWWTVLGPSVQNRSLRWNCRCVCGTERSVLQFSLTSGKSISCGCQKMSSRIKHGCAGSKLYYVWNSMICRCSKPSSSAYKWYGARGIAVCRQWMESFNNFASDMGPRPTIKHQIERIDNDGNYEPNNCRWATASEQARNRRDTPRITIDGVTKTRLEWCDIYGINEATVRKRIYKGMSPELAVTMPAIAVQNRERDWHGRVLGFARE